MSDTANTAECHENPAPTPVLQAVSRGLQGGYAERGFDSGRASMRPEALAPLILVGMIAQSAPGLALNPYRDIEWIALAAGFSAPRIAELAAAFRANTPVRALGGYLVGVAAGLSAVWLGPWALHVFTGRSAPGSPDVFRLVAALDLGFMVPALLGGGLLLWRRRPLGYVLATVAAIQAALCLFVLSVNSVLGIQRGLANWPGELPIWAPRRPLARSC